MSITITTSPGSTGLNMFTTAFRESDSSYWHNNSGVWLSPSVDEITKRHAMSPVTGASGLYSYVYSGMGSPGSCVFLVQESGYPIQGNSSTLVYDSEASSVENAYYADIEVNIDESGSPPSDEYTVSWFKNSTPIINTIPGTNIKVINRVDSTDLISDSSMSEVGNLGVYKFDATGDARFTKGESYIVRVSGTIDGATRTWQRLFSRDQGAD